MKPVSSCLNANPLKLDRMNSPSDVILTLQDIKILDVVIKKGFSGGDPRQASSKNKDLCLDFFICS